MLRVPYWMLIAAIAGLTGCSAGGDDETTPTEDQTTGKAVVLLPKKEKNAPQYRLESSFGYTDHKFANIL